MRRRAKYSASGVDYRTCCTVELLLLITVVVGPGALPAQAQPPAPAEPALPPPSLKTVIVPEPPNLHLYVRNRQAAIQLGKALFWDMQVGSDGVTACASCHFHAGADNRIKNALSPGIRAGDETFQVAGPNYTLHFTDFPLRALSDPEDRDSPPLWESNDIVSSLGQFQTDFIQTRLGFPLDLGTEVADPIFHVGAVNTRQVLFRNTPTVINAVFNAANFWDGRASHFFNGVSFSGPLDPNSGVFVNIEGVLGKQPLLISQASLASQAVAPPLASTEMSFAGRSWPQIGRKMLNLRPLDKQMVHPRDSVLGPLSRARLARPLDSKVSASDDTVPETSGSPVSLGGVPLAGQRGLFTTYEALIRDAFQPQYWNSNLIIEYQLDGSSSVIPRPAGMLADNQFTQMEANFSFFFGLAIQTYESTLVADDTPFDRYLDGDPDALTAEQLAGFDIFLDRGRCAQCHTGPELTEAALRGIELMFMASPGRAFYDRGFINIGVRPTAEDIGQGGTAPFINPVTGQPYPLSLTRLAMLKRAGQLPPAVSLFVPDLPFGTGSPDPNRVSVDGSLKVPGLRNVELTGPYFHNGGQATLRQVVDFMTAAATSSTRTSTTCMRSSANWNSARMTRTPW